MLRLDEVATRRFPKDMQPVPLLRPRQLHIQAHKAWPRRDAAAADAFEVDEDIRELLSLALLIPYGEGRRTKRPRSVGDLSESGLAPRSGFLALHLIRNGDRLVLDQDRAVGEPGNCEARAIFRL